MTSTGSRATNAGGINFYLPHLVVQLGSYHLRIVSSCQHSKNGPGIHPEQVKALYEDKVEVNERSGFALHLIKDLTRAQTQC